MTYFEPQAWRPLPAPPLSGDLEQNEALASAELWLTSGVGPEDVVVEADGSAIAGLEDGRIVRVKRSGSVDEIADVGGRPLGIEWLDEGVMVVCNADLGLQRVTVDGGVSSIVRGFDGSDFMFTNNATVAADGTIFFSDTQLAGQFIITWPTSLKANLRAGCSPSHPTAPSHSSQMACNSRTASPLTRQRNRCSSLKRVRTEYIGTG